MKCRRIKKWADDSGKEHTEVVWFGSYGSYPSRTLTCGPTTICGPNTIVGAVIEKSVMFYNPNDKHDNYSDKQQAVCDSLNQRLSVLKNELWYRVNYGLPLIDKVKSKLMVDAVVLSIINDHPDVSQIKQFKSVVVNHNYTFSATIISNYGQVLLQS